MASSNHHLQNSTTPPLHHSTTPPLHHSTTPPLLLPASTILTDPILICLGLDIAKAKIDACLLLGSRQHHAQFDNSKPRPPSPPRLVCKARPARAPHCARSHRPLPRTGRRRTPRRRPSRPRRQPAPYQGPCPPRRRRGKEGDGGQASQPRSPQPDRPHRRRAHRQLWHHPRPARLAARRPRPAAPARAPAPPRRPPIPAPRRAQPRRRRRRSSRLQKPRPHDPRAGKGNRAHRVQIAAHLQAAPDLHADLERLCQIEGLGERTAEEAEGTSGGRWTGEPRWLCAEVPRHLPNGRAATAWLAVTPRVRQSGSSLRHTAPVGIEGNRHLRRVLFMAAMVARRLNPRLAAAGKAKRSVLFAVLHKLIKTAFALLKNQSTYNPTHNTFLTAEN